MKTNKLTLFLLFVASLICFKQNCHAENIKKSIQLKTNELLKTGEKTVTVVCFGDSVTGLYYHTGGNRTYTDMVGIALKRIHPNAKIKMVNAGISGHTTVNALARIQKDVLDHKPTLVTVMYGLNDMTRVPLISYKKNLINIVSQLRKIGAEVILCTPNSIISTDSRPTHILEAHCDVIRLVAKEYHVALCDTYQEFEAVKKEGFHNWRAFLSDEIHPNMSGHKFIAEGIAKTITNQSVSLDDVDPLFPAIPRTKKLLSENKPVTVYAMSPYDSMVESAIQKYYPTAKVTVKKWDVKGKSISQLEKEAKSSVRPLKADLVIIAAPRSAGADSREQYVMSYTWLMNSSLSFSKLEWDCVVVHPSVADRLETKSAGDDLVRNLVRGQDLTLIDRKERTTQSAEEILNEWLKKQLGK